MSVFLYRFEINFQIGQSYGDGIAFHLNPRIALKYVYMNTLRNGKWEKDETVYDKRIPKETSFSLLILAKSEGYEVCFFFIAKFCINTLNPKNI